MKLLLKLFAGSLLLSTLALSTVGYVGTAYAETDYDENPIDAGIESITPEAAPAGTDPEASFSQSAIGGGTVGGPLTFGDIAAYIAGQFAPLVTGIALIVIIVAGLRMMVEDSEDQGTKGRTTILGALGAIILVNLAGPLQVALYRDVGDNAYVDPGGSAGTISSEISGIIDFLLVAFAALAILTIVITGIRAVVNYGREESATHFKRALIAIAAGIILVSFRANFITAIIRERRPDSILDILVSILTTILGFLGLLAVVFIVIAGLYMIINVGNDEQYRKAKGLVLRVIVGIIVVALSAALALFIISLF